MSFLLNLIPKAFGAIKQTISDLPKVIAKAKSEGKGFFGQLGAGLSRGLFGTPESRKQALDVASQVLGAVPKGSVASQLTKGVDIAKTILPKIEAEIQRPTPTTMALPAPRAPRRQPPVRRAPVRRGTRRRAPVRRRRAPVRRRRPATRRAPRRVFRAV